MRRRRGPSMCRGRQQRLGVQADDAERRLEFVRHATHEMDRRRADRGSRAPRRRSSSTTPRTRTERTPPMVPPNTRTSLAHEGRSPRPRRLRPASRRERHDGTPRSRRQPRRSLGERGAHGRVESAQRRREQVTLHPGQVYVERHHGGAGTDTALDDDREHLVSSFLLRERQRPNLAHLGRAGGRHLVAQMPGQRQTVRRAATRPRTARAGADPMSPAAPAKPAST